MSFAGRTVLVTGGSGFIGAPLCRELARAGAEVHSLSASGRAVPGTVRAWACDAAEADALRAVLRAVRPALVYHLASHVTGSRALDAVLPTFRAKLTGTVNLLSAAAELGGCRIVLAGSLEEPSDELEPVPVSPYAAATWASSGYARMFHRLYELPVVIARIFMVYGPGQANVRTLVPHVILSLLRGEAPELSSGVRPVDWVYVDDVVRGILALGAVDSLGGESVELGSGDLVTIRELVERVVFLLGSNVAPRFGALPDRPFERVRKADVGSARARTGWRPEVGLDEGLRRTIAYYRAQLSRNLVQAPGS
jgi:nucleoside-diphosphate-sugar epimerase